MVKTTLLAAKARMESIDGVDDYRSFMLFGFDMLIDDDGKVWLLEVNGAPAVAKSLLAPLAEDLISTAIDPYYERDYVREGKARENDFRKIFTSMGKESTCASMPAPTTGIDTGTEGIEAFGAGEVEAEGKSSRK